MLQFNFYKLDLMVLRPTRGLEFSESAHSIDIAIEAAKNLDLIRYAHTLRVFNQPIPDSFNTLVAWFLSHGHKPALALFVEEDVVIPENAIEEILKVMKLGADVAAINYHLKVGSPGRLSELRDHQDRLYTVSMGCTMISRRVLEALPPPWFRTDLVPGSVHRGSSQANPEPALVKSDAEYGGHDGYFTMRAQEAGFSVKTVPDLLCRHLRVKEFGRPNTNDGCHQIEDVL